MIYFLLQGQLSYTNKVNYCGYNHNNMLSNDKSNKSQLVAYIFKKLITIKY